MIRLAKLKKCLIFLLTFSTLSHADSYSHHIKGANQFGNAINQAVNSVKPSANVGMIIRSMKTGETIYSRNSKNLFVPASILKMLTAESALIYLGANYKFSTRFTTNGAIENDALVGDLNLVHSGDPTLEYTDLAQMVTDLKTKGIHKIIGNVFIDTTAYDQSYTGPGWLWTDRGYCYAAPISASIINHNCLNLQVGPGRYNGNSAQVYTNTNTFYAGIRNAVMTRNRSNHGCYVRLVSVNAGMVSLSGCIAKNNSIAGISAVINDVMAYHQALLSSLFARNGIRVTGEIYATGAKTGFKTLAQHDSAPLNELITCMLKMSDNVIAGSLFKKLGQTFSKRPGTWANGETAVHHILSKNVGVDIWRLSVIDGSGLSRYNQLSPQQMMQLLEFTFHHKGTNHDFVGALPIAGIDGTLKKRMRNISYRVRAKTGTLAGVISLAGYAMSADKEPYAFVIMVNGKHGSVWRYREMEDKVMTYLTHYTRV